MAFWFFKLLIGRERDRTISCPKKGWLRRVRRTRIARCSATWTSRKRRPPRNAPRSTTANCSWCYLLLSVSSVLLFKFSQKWLCVNYLAAVVTLRQVEIKELKENANLRAEKDVTGLRTKHTQDVARMRLKITESRERSCQSPFQCQSVNNQFEFKIKSILFQIATIQVLSRRRSSWGMRIGSWWMRSSRTVCYKIFSIFETNSGVWWSILD